MIRVSKNLSVEKNKTYTVFLELTDCKLSCNFLISLIDMFHMHAKYNPKLRTGFSKI